MGRAYNPAEPLDLTVYSCGNAYHSAATCATKTDVKRDAIMRLQADVGEGGPYAEPLEGPVRMSRL